MTLKTICIITGLLGITAAKANAQIQYIPAATHPFCISLGGGITNTFGDLNKKIFKPALRGNFDYNITPHISAGIEGQFGQLAGGDTKVSSNSEGLHSKSNFYAVNANIRAGLGQLLAPPENGFMQLLGGLYVGAGVGMINSEVSEIIEYYPANGKYINGKVIKETTELIIPVNLGLNIELPVYRLGANINLQYNMSQGEGLDGYDFSVSSNNDNDVYTFASVAIRYYFGPNRNFGYR